MNEYPSLIEYISPVSERYLTLVRVDPSRRYNYVKRGYYNFPVIEVDRHGPKCQKGESWLYFAIPSVANLGELTKNDRLYVGAQTQDRMFRGDGFHGENFHHAEMRAGNGDDNPVNLLRSGVQIVIYRASANVIADLILKTPRLQHLSILLEQSRNSKRHLGWWFEQYILFSEKKMWRWNTARANLDVIKLFGN